jgi:hypothetical protein
MKMTTQLQLVPRSRKVDLYLHCPIRLHGVVLIYIFAYRKKFALLSDPKCFLENKVLEEYHLLGYNAV